MRNGDTDQPRPRGRPKVTPDNIQRQSITSAARQLFMSKGYGGTTMDDIAMACHVSKRTLYRLFAAKPDLFAAVVEDHASEMLALPGNYDHLSLQKAIGEIFRLDISEQDNQIRFGTLMMLMTEASRFPELAHLIERHGAERQRKLLAEWLLRRATDGSIHITDGGSEARLLMDMIFGARSLKAGIAAPQWPDEADKRRHLALAVEIFSRGVARR